MIGIQFENLKKEFFKRKGFAFQGWQGW